MTAHVTAPMLAAYKHFLAVGFTENGAGAAVGNFCQESGEFLIAAMFRAHPDASGGVPDALKSGGIAEWLGSRKTAYIAFSGRAETRLGLAKGSLLNDLGTQCDFVVYELQTTPEYATLYQQLTSGSRSIANLTANFCWTYERPKAGPTAGLDNRIAHAEAVVRVAGTMKAPQAPQPAPPVLIPQTPVTHAPPSIPATPGPPHELPPISATVAGRQSAVIENLLGVLDAYKTERRSYLESIDKEISIVETTIADFGKLASLPAPPPLQIPGADPAAISPQRSQTVFGITNWKTALAGIVAGSAGVAQAIPSFKPYADIINTIGLIAAGIVGVTAKDGDVTGGTVPATPEAKRRVGA
jgi:hypothetical protein